MIDSLSFLAGIRSSSFRRRPVPGFFAPGQTPDSGLRPNDERAGSRRILTALLVFCALISQCVYAVDPLPFKDRAEELRFQALAKQLRCLVCQNESLADSNAPLAADLRRDVFNQMQAGKSDDEIKAWLTARYSDFVLYDPPLHGATLLLWFGPAIVLLAGGAAVVIAVRRRARPTTTAAVARPAIDAEDDW